MTAILILAAGAATPQHLNPVRLFLDADIVVQVVMGGLGLASIWVWTIMLAFTFRMAGVRHRCDAYERDFWQARDVDAFQAERGKPDIPTANVVAAALVEWRRSLAGKGGVDREAARQRLAATMDSAVALEAETLGDRLNFLATVGSVAPFVGLFGTVWGIMTSFFQIGQQQNSSLAVVAPGISEALAATAIGLFAAIPAVIAYNRFSHQLGGFEARLQRFADRFHTSLSRELDSL
jgi:biopolymer transport protein TolQ